MTSLSAEDRKRVGMKTAEMNKMRFEGWPECIQREGNEASYHRATEEWARRMEAVTWK